MHPNIYLFVHTCIRRTQLYVALYISASMINMCWINCKLFMSTIADGVLHKCRIANTHAHIHSSRRRIVCERLLLTVIMQSTYCCYYAINVLHLTFTIIVNLLLILRLIYYCCFVLFCTCQI